MQTVKLDFPDRDLYILKDGDWRGYRSSPCAKEPETVQWIRSFYERGVLWDVGASVGPYSLIAASHGLDVVAFEPFYPSLGHLQTNVWLNKFDSDIIALPFALSNETNWVSAFNVSTMSPGAGSHPIEWDSNKQHQHAPMITADEFASGMPGHWLPAHVKIDVDGAELGVIEGGRETWKNVQSIMVESEKPTIDDIELILSGAGLKLEQAWQRLGDTQQHNYLFRRV